MKTPACRLSAFSLWKLKRIFREGVFGYGRPGAEQVALKRI
jgi:hypothetical protein